MANNFTYETNHEPDLEKDIIMEDIKEFGMGLSKTLEQAVEEQRISSMTVFCDTEKLDEAFIGGVLVKVKGSKNNLWQMVYQLVRVIYKQQVEQTGKAFADDLLGLFCEKIQNGDDVFVFDPIDLLIYALKRHHPEFSEDEDEQ